MSPQTIESRNAEAGVIYLLIGNNCAVREFVVNTANLLPGQWHHVTNKWQLMALLKRDDTNIVEELDNADPELVEIAKSFCHGV